MRDLKPRRNVPPDPIRQEHDPAIPHPHTSTVPHILVPDDEQRLFRKFCVVEQHHEVEVLRGRPGHEHVLQPAALLVDPERRLVHAPSAVRVGREELASLDVAVKAAT